MKKLIIEIDDNFADAASMTFVGTSIRKADVDLTTLAVALKNNITAIAVDAMGRKIDVGTKAKTDENAPIVPLEKLQKAIAQLEDLRYDREDFADYEEEDNVFVCDIAAIDTALAAIKRLIDLDTFDAKNEKPSAKWEQMDNVYKLHAGKCNLSAVKCSNCKSVICDVFHVSEKLKYCPVCGAKMDNEEK